MEYYENAREYIRWIRNGFICVYVLYLIFLQTKLTVYCSTYCVHNMSRILYKGLPVIGMVIAGTDLAMNFKSLWKKENTFAIFFLMATLVSIIINYRYDFLANVKTLFIMAMQLYIFYVIGVREARNEGRLLGVVANLYVAAWAIPVAISLYQFLIGYGIKLDKTFGEYENSVVGFYGNRLFGVFGDPNYAAVGSILAIFFALICLRKKKIWCKIYYIITIILAWLYIVLSGSRTCLLAIVVSIPMVTCICLIAYFRRNSIKNVYKFIVIPATCVVLFGAILGLVTVTKKVALIRTEIIGTEVSLDRDDVVNSDNISNNRFAIWKDAVKIWETTPVIGATPRGYLDYAKDVCGDLYIVKRGYMVHNGYISVLLFSGIIGAIVMLLWCISLARSTVRLLVSKKISSEKHQRIVLLAVAQLALVVAAMTLTMIFYSTTVVDVMFWGISGYLLSQRCDDEILY